MKKIIAAISILALFHFNSFSQRVTGQVNLSGVPVPRAHYLPEYIFDNPSDADAWIKQKSGIHAAFASTDIRYLRSEVPPMKAVSGSWEATGWKGERINAQILIWSADTLQQVKLESGDLSDPMGHILNKKNSTLSLVRYVLSNLPYGDEKSSCDAGSMDTAYLVPDRLEKYERFDLPGKSIRSIWVSIEIPRDIEAGLYSGEISVMQDKQRIQLPVKIKIQQQVLPKPHEWNYRLDLWQNPWVIALYYHVVPWSEEHMLLLKKHLRLYADAGGKYITTYAVYSPWQDNSYMIEGTMIEWLKKKDGSWQFDYSIFDQYVKLCMEVGIDKAITIYSPVPWGHRFRFMDEASGNYVYEVWHPESQPYKTFWNLFLSDLKKHLTERGWFGMTYIGINENPIDITLEVARMVKAHSPDWKITYAGAWNPELTRLLDDYCPFIGTEPSPKELAERKAMGFTTTYYVACGPARPNNFVFSPPVESRFISWYAAAYGYDGFLRWAYDAWPADPLRDARHIFWPAGDCFMVYPGGNSSVRFEKLREGIVDYEKIRLLKEMSGRSTSMKVKSLWTELEIHLHSFTGDPDVSKRNFDSARITGMIRKGEKLVAELSDALGK